MHKAKGEKKEGDQNERKKKERERKRKRKRWGDQKHKKIENMKNK
jgi:hypothetical protein